MTSFSFNESSERELQIFSSADRSGVIFSFSGVPTQTMIMSEVSTDLMRSCVV